MITSASFSSGRSYLLCFAEDLSLWPRCLAWHDWLPGLGDTSFGSNWAESVYEVATDRLDGIWSPSP